MSELQSPEAVARHVAAELEKFVAWQVHIQGQVNALRVALAACLSFSQMNPDLVGHVQKELSDRLHLMKEGGDTVGEILGYESVLRELVPDKTLLSGTPTAH